VLLLVREERVPPRIIQAMLVQIKIKMMAAIRRNKWRLLGWNVLSTDCICRMGAAGYRFEIKDLRQDG